MTIETKYATIDRDELRRLQSDSEELAKLLAAQQQAEPATHSGDGREPIPDCCQGENCGTRTADHSPECISETERDIQEWVKSSQSSGYSVQPIMWLNGETLDYELSHEPWMDESTDWMALMTVAQHERIVAAKMNAACAEIDRLQAEYDVQWRGKAKALDANAKLSELVAELRAKLDAQPARQVGGGGGLKPCPFCGNEKPLATHDDYIHENGQPMPVVECTNCHTWVRAESWNSRAALAPAAAVTDADVETAAQLIYTQWDAVAGYVPWVKGGNSTQQDYARKLARDLFARLNRNAIPAGLLERIAKIPLGSQGLLDHASAMDELRALLGKEVK